MIRTITKRNLEIVQNKITRSMKKNGYASERTCDLNLDPAIKEPLLFELGYIDSIGYTKINEELKTKIETVGVKDFFKFVSKFGTAYAMPIPAIIIKKVLEYEMVSRSPYSDSYYDSKDIDWGYKPIGSLRISDHWNFVSQNEIHCKLTNVKRYTRGWKVAKFNGLTYDVIEEIQIQEEEH